MLLIKREQWAWQKFIGHKERIALLPTIQSLSSTRKCCCCCRCSMHACKQYEPNGTELNWAELSSQAQLLSNRTAWLSTTETFIVHIIQSTSMVYKPSDHLTLIHCCCCRFFVSFCFRLFNLLLYVVSYVYDVMPFHLNYSKLFSVVVFFSDCLFLCCMSNYFEFVMRFLPRYYYSLNVLKFVLYYMRNAYCTHSSTPHTHSQSKNFILSTLSMPFFTLISDA